MEKKECTIIGFGKYKSKETNEEMLRIIIGIDSISENYTGTMVVAVHLDYSSELEEQLNNAYETGEIVRYTTTDNIVTGKTRINKLIFQ